MAEKYSVLLSNRRMLYLTALLVFCIGIALITSYLMGVDIIYTHLFYLPIVLGALWFYKKALWLAVFLSIVHIVINYLVIGDFVPNAILRAIVFILIAYVVGALSEKQDLYAKELGRSRDRLKEEQDFLAAVFDTQGALVIVLDASGCIIRFNRAFEQITGYTFAELRGTPFWDILIPPEQKEDVLGVFQKVWVAQQPDTHVNNWKTKDGDLRLISWSNAPILGREGYTSYLVAAGIDITEQKKAKDALQKAQREKTLILESLAEIVTYQDREQRIIWANPAAANSFGMTVEELLGQTCYKVWQRRQTPCEGCPVRLALENGQTCSGEVNFPDGRCWSITGSPVRDEQEEIVGVVETALEITERKRAETAIKKLNEELELRVRERTAELEALNRELDAFSYSVSHDLRAPLRSIDGFSRALLEDYTECLDEQGRDYLHRVCDSSRRMGELIDDLLKLSHVTRLEMYRERIDLSAIVLSSLERLQAQEPQRQVETAITLGIYAEGDASLLRIAMENLLNNAWKFTDKETCARIEFGITSEFGQLVCYIRDNGAGFDMAHEEKLFRAFQRLHDPDLYPGTGIGLSIVARIMQRHGGDIWAQGEAGEGAIFYFTLPRLKHEQTAEQ